MASALAGCAPIVDTRGNMVDSERMATVKVGQSGREQVLQSLGSPSATALFDDEVWYYIGKRTETLAFFAPEVLEQQVVVVRFDRDGVVSAIDNRIDAKSRTLHVQASIDNTQDVLRAGMSFQVEMRFPGDTYPAVDPLAVQWGADGAFVWLIEDGVARRVGVRIVQRNTDSILVSGELGTAGQVVTEGIHAVREGAPVRLVGGEAGQAPTAAVTGS